MTLDDLAADGQADPGALVLSACVQPLEHDGILTTTEYGYAFVSSVWRDNVYATQFHPEKSQSVGLKMLENFAAL